MNNFILRSISSVFLLAIGAGIWSSEIVKDIVACTVLVASFYELRNIKSIVYSILVLLGVIAMAFTKHMDVFHALVFAWAHDTGGYFFGKFLGGSKIAPSISPNKTWAGFIGGWMLVTCIVLYLLSNTMSIRIEAKIILAFAINTICLLGDLIESYVKRQADIKDSGDLIPGHGGVLDRFDAFLLLMIAVFIFKRWQ